MLKKSQLTATGWFPDTAGNMECTPDNRGHVKRTELAEQSKIISLFAKPCIDLCNQHRLIPNGIDIKLRFVRSTDSFCIMGDGKLVVKEAALYVRKVKLSPTVRLAHIKALERGTAKFPIKRVEVKTFTVPQGNLMVNHENLFLGQLPNRLLLGMVENQSFVGHSSKNPFNFKHFDTDCVALFLDGAQIGATDRTWKCFRCCTQVSDTFHSYELDPDHQHHTLNQSDSSRSASVSSAPSPGSFQPQRHSSPQMQADAPQEQTPCSTLFSSSSMDNTTDIEDHIPSKARNWRSMVVNVNSIVNKKAEFETAVNYYKPDAIFMSETKLSQDIAAQSSCLPVTTPR